MDKKSITNEALLGKTFVCVIIGKKVENYETISVGAVFYFI